MRDKAALFLKLVQDFCSRRDLTTMATSSDNRPYEGSVEYTAVELNDEFIDDTSEDRAYEDSVASAHQSIDANQQVSNAIDNGQQFHQAGGSSKTISEETTGATIARTIAGWPQGPRQLDGVSIPFLIGDLLLILLPVAFLGA